MRAERNLSVFTNAGFVSCVFSIFFFVTIIIFSDCLAQDYKSYTIATAPPGGTFYRVGFAIAALVTEDLETEGISLTSRSTDGSKENIRLMLEEQVEFALLQGFVGALVADGKEDFKSKEIKASLRSVAPVWLNVEHFMVLKDSVRSETDTVTVDELVALERLEDAEKSGGKPRFSIGRLGSGTRLSGLHILTSLGITHPHDVFEMNNLDYSDSAEELVKRRIEGINTPAGVPVMAVKKVFNELASDVVMLNFKRKHLDMVNKPYELWSMYSIKPETYTGQKNMVQTIAQPNFLAVRENVNEYDVCRITELIYSNRLFFENVHESTKIMFQENVRNEARKKLPFDEHLGARRYYKNMDETNPCDEPTAHTNEDGQASRRLVGSKSGAITQ